MVRSSPSFPDRIMTGYLHLQVQGMHRRQLWDPLSPTSSNGPSLSLRQMGHCVTLSYRVMTGDRGMNRKRLRWGRPTLHLLPREVMTSRHHLQIREVNRKQPSTHHRCQKNTTNRPHLVKKWTFKKQNDT